MQRPQLTLFGGNVNAGDIEQWNCSTGHTTRNAVDSLSSRASPTTTTTLQHKRPQLVVEFTQAIFFCLPSGAASSYSNRSRTSNHTLTHSLTHMVIHTLGNDLVKTTEILVLSFFSFQVINININFLSFFFGNNGVLIRFTKQFKHCNLEFHMNKFV